MVWQRHKHLIFTLGLVIIYNDWLLGPVLNPRLSANRSLISELSAGTQPYHWVFQSLDILAGVLTLAALPWLWKFLRKSKVAYWQILFVTIAAIGADSIADALLPISCAPTVDAGCNLAATHSILTQAHLIESFAIGVATFAAPLLWWHFCKASHRLISRTSLWFVGFQLFIGASVLASRAFNLEVVGSLQRSYELAISLWVCGILFVALVQTARRPAESKSQPALTYEPDPTPVI